jgi:hypothetical protein
MLCKWLVARLIRIPGPDSSGSILANGLGAQNTSGLEVTLGRLSLLRTNDLVTSTVLGQCTATVDRDYNGRDTANGWSQSSRGLRIGTLSSNGWLLFSIHLPFFTYASWSIRGWPGFDMQLQKGLFKWYRRDLSIPPVPS